MSDQYHQDIRGIAECVRFSNSDCGPPLGYTVGEYVCSDCVNAESKTSLKILELEIEVKELSGSLEKLTAAHNEALDKIQALLDFCFTDKSRWREGSTDK